MKTPTTIKVLVENSVPRAGLTAEHGLAFWIKSGSQNILFDTGQTGLITTNAANLGIDIETVDVIALSHGHYDHTGGLPYLLTDTARKINVYIHPNGLLPKYHCANSSVRNIGIPPESLNALYRENICLNKVDKPVEIAPGIFLTGEIPRINPDEEASGGFYQDPQCTEIDHLMDDQSMYFTAPQGVVVLLGCTHSGVVNTLEHIRNLTHDAPFHMIAGGMHLGSVSDERLKWTISELNKFNIQKIFPMHCTGIKAISALWNAFPRKCFPCGVGTELKVMTNNNIV